MAASALPALPTTLELVADNLHEGVIHGWHSGRLLRHGGELYACGTVNDPDACNEWKTTGVFWRREPDGVWSQIGTLDQAPYAMYLGPLVASPACPGAGIPGTGLGVSPLLRSP